MVPSQMTLPCVKVTKTKTNKQKKTSLGDEMRSLYLSGVEKAKVTSLSRQKGAGRLGEQETRV